MSTLKIIAMINLLKRFYLELWIITFKQNLLSTPILKQNNYSGDFIIQGARESGIDSGETAKKYLKFVKELVDKYMSNDSDNL